MAYYFYPYARDFSLFTQIVRHNGRQKFFIGFLNQNNSNKDFESYLIKKGFEHSILSWIDDGEILSMRKRVHKRYQYHIRLFDDGEIRGHYEYSPESKPLAHLCEVCFLQEESYFKSLLGIFLRN